MEGFRYRVDDTIFPVFHGPDQLNKGTFPIIPIGMLDVWRQQDKLGEQGTNLDDFF
jgi:hypothetical protein